MKHVQDNRKPTDEPNLRNAFSPVPPDVRELLVQTARSVKEEEKVKTRKYRLSPVLLAALIVFATMSVGLAVSESVGWSDFFGRFHHGSVPAPMQQALNQAEHTTYELGPVTFTVDQALCDGMTGIVSISARTTDGSAALLASTEDFNMPISSSYLDTELARLGLEEGTTWLEAAKQKNLPLYAVHAVPRPGQYADDQYEDYLHDAEGAFVDFSGFTVDPEELGDTVSLELFLSVSAIDPETGEITQQWQDRPEYTVPVDRSILAEKTYTPEEPLDAAGLRLENVRMELRITGAYVYTTFTASDSVDHENEAWMEDCYQVEIMSADGDSFSTGVSMSGSCDDSAWPTVVLSDTIMIDALPDAIGVKLSYDDETVHLLK